MGNKRILFGLFFALLHALSAKGADPDSSLDGGPFTIYSSIDAGKDIERFSSLAETIEAKQRRIDDELNKMSVKIEALEKRMVAAIQATEEKWKDESFKMEIKATERRMSAEITRLNQKIVELSNLLAKSPDVATPRKRPAELACDKITNDLRSIGDIDITAFAKTSITLYATSGKITYCHGNFIDRRFVITSGNCVDYDEYRIVKFVSSVWKKVKAIHIHPNYTSEKASLNNIALIELESDVDYSRKIYPMCLYASQFNPERDLTGPYGKVQIIADAECYSTEDTDLKPSEICAKSSDPEIFAGYLIYTVQEQSAKYQLFGIVTRIFSSHEPFVITKVFEHLDFIEGIVWPKSDI